MQEWSNSLSKAGEGYPKHLSGSKNASPRVGSYGFAIAVRIARQGSLETRRTLSLGLWVVSLGLRNCLLYRTETGIFPHAHALCRVGVKSESNTNFRGIGQRTYRYIRNPVSATSCSEGGEVWRRANDEKNRMPNRRSASGPSV